jgi:hypothetical protein
MAIESLASLLAMRMVNVNSLHNDRGIRRLAEGVEFIRHEIKCNNVDPIIRVSGSYISAFLNDIRRRFDELCDCERRRILGNSRMEAESQQLEAWLTN